MSSAEVSYPAIIRRCHYIKVNGIQCGSPALRSRNLCFFHYTWKTASADDRAQRRRERGAAPFRLPILEDANSIQVSLMEVMRLLLVNEIEHKTAALLLYALQTAAHNLRHINFDPRPEQVITDKEQLKVPIGADAWSKQTLEAAMKQQAEQIAAEEEVLAARRAARDAAARKEADTRASYECFLANEAAKKAEAEAAREAEREEAQKNAAAAASEKRPENAQEYKPVAQTEEPQKNPNPPGINLKASEERQRKRTKRPPAGVKLDAAPFRAQRSIPERIPNGNHGSHPATASPPSSRSI